MITHNREFITPEIAKAYLETSTGNRKIKETSVDAYVRQIKAGKFVETHQGIAFDESGHLLDGHHRLAAVIKAQMGIWVDVARGVPRNSVMFVDNGDMRSFTDSLYFAGAYPNDVVMHHKQTVATVRQLIGFEIPHYKKPTYDELFYIMDKLSKPLHILYDAATCRTSPAPAAMKAAGLAAILAGEKPTDIYTYFGIYCNGNPSADESKNSVIVFNWRQQVATAKLRSKPFNRYALYYGTQNAIWHYIHDAETGKMRQKITSTDTVRYPVKKLLIELIQR